MRRAGVLLGLALALASGCMGEKSSGGDGPAEVWAFGKIRDEARKGGAVAGIPAAKLIDFRGEPIALRSPPYAAAQLLQDPSFDGAPVFPMFMEGKPAAYVATDFWYDRDEVWVQPVWIPVTAWDPQKPFAHVIPKSNWIFSVGPDSAFYSPYWRFEFVEVPEDTQPNQLRSAADVLNASKGIHDGALWIFSLLPLDVRVSAPAGADPVRPLNGDALMPVKLRQGWVEGQLWGVFDYGLDLFTTHGDDVVDETPIYRFVRALPDGGEDPIDVPEVGGVGAPFSGAGPKLQGGAPTFGGLWRLYDVALPSTAAVFVPPSLPEMRQRLAAQGAVQVPELPDAVGGDPRAGDYALRVAVDGACFDGGFPDGCTWLDSQAALEAAIPEASILATDVTTTCPILEYLGQPVPSP